VSKVTVWFIRLSMVYFLMGSILGVLMIMRPEWVIIYRPVHVHLNLLGWVSMLIYGVGYHILPRFSGQPLHSEKMAEIQFWLVNFGLVGLAVSWILYRQGCGLIWWYFLVFFAIIETMGILFFIYNIFRTIRAID